MDIKYYGADESNYEKGRKKTIKYIVVHYTANDGDTAKGNCNYFSGANRGASAHYFVDENEIYQSVNDADTAWHCGAKTYVHKECRNYNSIGVELCSRKDSDGKYYFKEKTVDNAVWLVMYLMKKYSISAENVIRHYDVTGKICPAPFVKQAEWEKFKERVKGDDEMVVSKEVEMFGIIRTVQVIEKDGYNYIKMQDLNKSAELSVTYDNIKKLPKISLSKV
jgi:N-acetylmuramoyl-L-alanine amidase